MSDMLLCLFVGKDKARAQLVSSMSIGYSSLGASKNLGVPRELYSSL